MSKYDAEIIKMLQADRGTFLTSTTIAQRLGITKRTVMNSIKDINAVNEIIICTSQGYKIDAEFYDENLNVDREDYLVWKLLSPTPSNLYDIADELYVSYSTVKKDLNKIQEEVLNNYNLKISYNRDNISLEGSEKNIRKLFDWQVRRESKNNFTTFNLLQDKFPGIDIYKIKDIVSDNLQSSKLFVNDFQLLSIVLHSCIAIKRSMTGNVIDNDSSIKNINIESFEYIASNKILDQISDYCSLPIFSLSEKNAFALLIMSNSTSPNSNFNIDEYIDSKQEQLLSSIFIKVYENFGINLNSSSFRNKFAIHLNNLLIRYQNNLTSKNDLLLSTKTSFPLIFEIAAYISSIIFEHTGFMINDEEIGFIAFHIGNEIDEQIQKENLLSCAIVSCYYNRGIFQLANKLNSLFGTKIIVNSIKTIEQYTKENLDYDLILSVIPLEIDVPYIQIHPMLSDDDINKIETKISSLITHNKNKQMRNDISNLFKKEFFFKNPEILNKEQLLSSMCETLKENDYADDRFLDSVFEREKLSSTAFGNYAIPHSLKIIAKKTTISVVLSKKPIKWGDTNVNFIFLLCVNQNDKDKFRGLFSSIIYLLKNDDVKNKLLNINDFDDFIDTIKSYL